MPIQPIPIQRKIHRPACALLLAICAPAVSANAVSMASAAKPAEPPAKPASADAAAPKIATGYKVGGTIALPGDTGWDYLYADAAARRLYVSHGDRVAVVDADRNAPRAEIAGLSGVHGIAVAPGLGRGFISNGKTSTITVFDLATDAKVAEWKSTGENPDAILFEPRSGRLFAFNGRSANATVFDAKTGAVVSTLALGGKPEFATTDGEGHVFVNVEDTSEVAFLDATVQAGPTVLSRHPLAPCEEPSGMAIDRAHHRLWIACSNALAAVVDSNDGKVLATLPSGQGSDGAAFDPSLGYGFTSNGEGTLSVFGESSPGHFAHFENVATRKGARTVALDEKTHRLFLSTADLGSPPAPTAEMPHPRPTIKPGSFVVLVVERP